MSRGNRIFLREEGWQEVDDPFVYGGLIFFASEGMFSGDNSWKERVLFPQKLAHCNSKEGLGTRQGGRGGKCMGVCIFYGYSGGAVAVELRLKFKYEVCMARTLRN